MGRLDGWRAGWNTSDVQEDGEDSGVGIVKFRLLIHKQALKHNVKIVNHILQDEYNTPFERNNLSSKKIKEHWPPKRPGFKA